MSLRNTRGTPTLCISLPATSAAIKETQIDEFGTLFNRLDDQLKKWKNHFKTVLNRLPPVDPQTVQAAQPLDINTCPTPSTRSKQRYKSLKNSERVGGLTSMNILHDLVNRIWDNDATRLEKDLPVKLPKKGIISY